MWHVRIGAAAVALVVPPIVTFCDKIGWFCSIRGKSMQPVINPEWPWRSDWVFQNKRACRDFKFKRGEIVCFTSPRDKGQIFIKRIIALEGDVVIPRKEKRGRAESILIPEGHCWVEGDNTTNSVDSNRFGPIPLGLIYAKAYHIFWPPDRWQRLDTDELESDRVRTAEQRKKDKIERMRNSS